MTGGSCCEHVNQNKRPFGDRNPSFTPFSVVNSHLLAVKSQRNDLIVLLSVGIMILLHAANSCCLLCQFFPVLLCLTISAYIGCILDKWAPSCCQTQWGMSACNFTDGFGKRHTSQTLWFYENICNMVCVPISLNIRDTQLLFSLQQRETDTN